MKNERFSLGFVVITAIVLALAFSRLFPHPFNFSPVAALALFGGARYKSRVAAYMIPLAAVWSSDLVLNYAYYGRFVAFYDGAFVTYAAFALIVLLGSRALRYFSARKLLFTSLAASVVFFVVSNLGVWAFSGMYALTPSGLGACFAAAIPFFRNTLSGDLVYSFVIFYAFEFAGSKVPLLKTAN